MNDKHSNSYEERLAAPNVAEVRFEFYCEGKNIWHCRMGFDETGRTVPMFYKIHPLIRSLPDYLMKIKDKLYYVHVKGTNKLKLFDYEQYSTFYNLYCNLDTPLVLAFCFKDGGRPIFRSMDWIIKLVQSERLEIKRFPSDNKEYIEIPV